MEKHNIFSHVPVLLDECINGLNIKPDGIYVDGTLGGAGHSSVIASKLRNGKLIGIDKDDDALFSSKQRLKDYDFVTFVKSDFKNYKNILAELGIDKVDGILLDLGVSSYQIDTAERGFSFKHNGPLDMRMDKTQSFSAYDVVNTYSEEKLAKVIYEYGEEKFARPIARNIVKERSVSPIETTEKLNEIIEHTIPRKLWGSGASRKTFQAIRIEVNGELTGLESVVRDMIESLKSGGRLCIITFHSLEDRIIKNVFKEYSTDCICDKSIPVCVCGHKASVKLINKKPILASETELEENSRSSCAKLRIIEKL